MSKNKGTFWSNGYTQTVLGGLALFLITDYFIKANLIGVAGRWLVNLFSTKYTIPLWLLILIFLGGVILTTLLLFINVRKESGSGAAESDPPWFKYNRDTFDSPILFKWEWNNYFGRVEILTIQEYCVKDNCKLIGQDCPVCKRRYYNGKSDTEIRTLIQYKVENNLWQDVVARY